MMKVLFPITLIALIAGCTPEPRSSIGFRLPEGNIERGLEAFTKLNCRGCHSLIGEPESKLTDSDLVLLGGEVTRVRTYGELVTSIINPSHKIAAHTPESAKLNSGSSMMEFAYLNEVMTINELIDLVSFLQSKYEVVPPELSPYDRIYP